MALSPEDRKDVARSFGKKAAGAVSAATNDNFLKGKRGVAKSGSGSWMSITSGRGKADSSDSVRHGFSSKQEARAHSKAKSRALDAKAGKPKKEMSTAMKALHKEAADKSLWDKSGKRVYRGYK